MLHDSVLSKTKLEQRGMQVPTICLMCNETDETPLHIFRDCEEIKQLWTCFVPENFQQSFFQANFEDWVNMNIAQTHRDCKGKQWNVIFLVICWWQWRFCNDVNFADKASPPNYTFLEKKIKEVAKSYEGIRKDSRKIEEIHIGWTSLPFDW